MAPEQKKVLSKIDLNIYMYCFLHAFIRIFIYSFTHSIILSPSQLFNSFTYKFIRYPIHSVTRLFIVINSSTYSSIEARESIKNGKFPEFVNKFMSDLYPDLSYPAWAENAFNSVNIQLKHS